jgi:hypothetical protein
MIKRYNEYINENIQQTISLTDVQIEDIYIHSYGYDNFDDAKSEINKLLDYYNNLDFSNGIKLYRIIFVENKDQIKTNFFGPHWSMHEPTYDFAERVRDSTSEYDPDKLVIVISATFNKSDVDFFQTIKNNMRYPSEEEITIRKNAKPIEYTITEYPKGYGIT